MNDVKQVIVMRNDLGMRKGKMIAQGSHSSIAFLTNKIKNSSPAQRDFGQSQFALINMSEAEELWIRGIFKKVCLKVDSEQELLDIHTKALEAGLVSYLITDAGLTEFNGVPTNTCIGIGPDYADKIDVITGHLKLL